MSFREIYDYVWKWRSSNEWFPIPEPADSMRYAVTEAAEAIDAHLRLTRVNDVRANERGEDPFSELGDVVFMIVTAMPRDDDVEMAIQLVEGYELLDASDLNIDSICYMVFELYGFYFGCNKAFRYSFMQRSVYAVRHIEKYMKEHGLDLLGVVKSRLKRIEQKRK